MNQLVKVTILVSTIWVHSVSVLASDEKTLDTQKKSRDNDCSALSAQYRVEVLAAGSEKSELTQICHQSLSILKSKEFRANLLLLKNKDNKVISRVSKKGPHFLTFEQLADVIILKYQDSYKFRSHFVLHGTYFPTGKVYTGTCKNIQDTKKCKAYESEDNRHNEFAATRIVTQGADSILESVIGRKIHERWRSDSIVRRSCAINTFSHELMHAFSTFPTTGYHEGLFIDTLALDKPVETKNHPLGTYLVGTVAQCTWLQQKGYFDSSKLNLESCVAEFGLDKFNSDECK